MDLLLSTRLSPCSLDTVKLSKMCHQSPSKLLRSVKRITKFLQKKGPVLTTNKLPGLDIPPFHRKLSIVHVQETHVLSQSELKPILGFSKAVVISFVPNQQVLSESSYSHSMDFVKTKLNCRQNKSPPVEVSENPP